LKLRNSGAGGIEVRGSSETIDTEGRGGIEREVGSGEGDSGEEVEEREEREVEGEAGGSESIAGSTVELDRIVEVS